MASCERMAEKFRRATIQTELGLRLSCGCQLRTALRPPTKKGAPNDECRRDRRTDAWLYLVDRGRAIRRCVSAHGTGTARYQITSSASAIDGLQLLGTG